MAKAVTLEKAYLSEQVPFTGAFIVSAFFPDETAYAIYEITAYRTVKDIFKTTEGMIFKTDGNRTCILIEPATYAKKYIEPVNREVGKSVPYRFDEMTIFSGQKSEKIMIPLEPTYLYASFTILDHGKDSYSYIFFPTPDVYMAMRSFISDSLHNDCDLAKSDATNGAETALNTIKKFSIWKS
jgi:hypothetical protein